MEIGSLKGRNSSLKGILIGRPDRLLGKRQPVLEVPQPSGKIGVAPAPYRCLHFKPSNSQIDRQLWLSVTWDIHVPPVGKRQLVFEVSRVNGCIEVASAPDDSLQHEAREDEVTGILEA